MARFSRSVGVVAVVAVLWACGGESKRSGATNGDAGAGATTDTTSAGQASGNDMGADTVGGATEGGNGAGLGGSAGVSGSSGLGGMNANAGSGALSGMNGNAGSDALAGSNAGGTLNAPGCPPENIDSCDPGPNEICTSLECASAELSPFGVDERGDGVFCKYLPDANGPDFACLRGEWCQFELQLCRCGTHPGCQRGETCIECTRGDCKGEYHCERDIACTEDNLDSCGAEPGQTCPDGSHACAEPVECPDMAQGPGATLCAGAANGCCPAGHWCFDGRECRCGAHPACSAGEECALDYRQFYACSAR
jgi:hypothetical protein